MNRRALFAAALALTAVLVELGPSSRRALAQPNSQDPTGTWVGFFASPTMMGRVTFEITNLNDHRRFMAMTTFVFENGMTLPPFAGPLTRDANNGFAGKVSGDAGEVIFNGDLDFLGGGAAKAMAMYDFMPAAGVHDRGMVCVLRGFTFEPNNPPPNVNGMWEGSYASSMPGGPMGSLTFDIMQGTGGVTAPMITDTSFMGMLTVTPLESFGMFAAMGTINGDGKFFFIAQGTGGKKAFVQGQVMFPASGGPATATAMYEFMVMGVTMDTGTAKLTQGGT